MLTLLSILLYLLPVLPVARRAAYVITKKADVPKRTLMSGGSYVYVNGNIARPQQVCQNCGAERSFHKRGSYRIIAFDGEDRICCSNFVKWDGKRTEWPDATWRKDSHTNTVIGLVIGMAWPLAVAYELGHQGIRHFEPEFTFAKPYHGVESRSDREKRIETERAAELIRAEQEKQALKARIETLEKEAGLTPHKEIR